MLAYPGKPFPPEHDEACVLCHQPLTAEAKTRMVSFETFIKEDTETQAGEAENSFAEAVKSFVENKVDIRTVAQTAPSNSSSEPGARKKRFTVPGKHQPPPSESHSGH